jgi:hypothetical protein
MNNHPYDSRDERNSILQERINLLKKQGYRGYTISRTEQAWDGVKVTVEKPGGKKLSGEGETPDEAFENVIDVIDYTLDDTL